MKKKVLILLLSAACCCPAPAQNWFGDISLRTQAQVDSFPIVYGPVQELWGSLILGSGNGTNYTNISDLSPLASIHQIWGSLVVFYSEPLQSLHGLEALDTVDYNVAIIGNPNLQNLQGLQSLRKAGMTLVVENNDALHNLEGLEQLHNVSYEIIIRDNDSLLNLQGMSAIAWGSTVYILNNDNLQSLDGMDSLYHVLGIRVIGNDRLEHATGFRALREASGIIVQDNLKLIDFVGGLGSPDSIALRVLTIQDNPRLRTLDGLQNIKTLTASARIERNDSLQSLYGLGLERLGHPDYFADLYVQDNPLLTDLALNRLRTIGCAERAYESHVEIRRNRSLKALNGFAVLDSCYARLWIAENDSLKTVDIPSLRYGYNFLIDTDSSEGRVGPFANLESVEKEVLVYGAKYIEGFPKLKSAGVVDLVPFEGYVRGFNQLKDAPSISIQGRSRVVDGFHNMRKGGGITCLWVSDTLKAFEQLDTLARPGFAQGGLGFRVYDNCYFDSAFSKLQYMKGSSYYTQILGESDPTHLGNHLPNFASLKKIGFRLQFYGNTPSLRSINAFPQLTHIGPPTHNPNNPGGLFIYGNGVLNSLDGLEHLSKITGVVEIYQNDSLADCSALCPVLQHAVISGPVSIHSNPFPCSTKPEILAWCDTAYVSTIGLREGLPFELWPNPTTGSVSLQLPANAPLPCSLSLCDLGGRVLWQAEAAHASPDFVLPPLPAGAYIFSVNSGGQRGWRRLVLLPK